LVTITSGPVFPLGKILGVSNTTTVEIPIHVRKRGHDRNFSVGSPTVQPCIGSYGPRCIVPRFLRHGAVLRLMRSLPGHVTFFFLHEVHIPYQYRRWDGYGFRRTNT
jgi:hypothetical protein